MLVEDSVREAAKEGSARPTPSLLLRHTPRMGSHDREKPGPTKVANTLGYLTVVKHDQFGLSGGYLLLNSHGRPLEFHCTAPVKANRAQEILFGPTLDAFLYGEQIGAALLAKTELTVGVVCIDQPAMLAVRDLTSLPVALLLSDHEPTSDKQPSWRLDAAHTHLSDEPHFMLGSHRVTTCRGHEQDRTAIERVLLPLAERFDLSEPFERIREAIEEAQRSGR